MSERIGGLIIIEPEPHDKCEDCGQIAELRPYGIDGMRICHDCGMKDETSAHRNMDRILFGIQPKKEN
jgi:hypothetical protein